jgi:myo-inositol-1(or 4)-monophosphatase
MPETLQNLPQGNSSNEKTNQLQRDEAFLHKLVREAGQLLLKHFLNRDYKTKRKADQTIVTEADLAADRYIAESILAAYPDDILLSEELQPSYTIEQDPEPGRTDLRVEADSALTKAYRRNRHVWIVDPIDGTTNFSLGLPIWGVLITRLTDGMPDITTMYFPGLDELYTARKGGGAFLNGEPVHVQPAELQETSTFFTCCSRTYRYYNIKVPYKPRILGSAAYSFCSVGRGAAALGFEATPKMWDIAGGWLFVHEAGGLVKTFDGSQPFPLAPGISYSTQSYPIIIAADAKNLALARKWIEKK